MTSLEILKAKLKKLGPQLEDTDYDLALDEVAVHIKNYCSIDVIPEGLNFTWANIAKDLMIYQFYSNLTPENQTDPDIDMSLISSLKIGDTTIQLGAGSSVDEKLNALKSHKPSLDTFVMNYKEELNKFRRMVW